MSPGKVVIIGAGPAGTRAAQCLVSHGVVPTVITEAASNGGQIYRRQPSGFTRTAQQLYGSEAHKANSLHATFDRFQSALTFRPNTTVWNIVGQTLHLETPSGIETLEYDSLILATGAMDRVIPMPGWTLPGVYSLGGAQVALKYQACTVGEKVAFTGNGPLLYLVAYQYAKAGARVAGVFDTANLGGKIAALPQMLWSPRATLLGLYYMACLKAKGVPLEQGISPVEIGGSESVKRYTYRLPSGAQRSVDCDAVALGYGLKPESQLAELAGCPRHFDAEQRLWVVSHDGTGRVRPGLYVAGDCSAIGGADVAELQGELAALRLLDELQIQHSHARAAQLTRKLQRLRRFRIGLERAFPLPQQLVRSLPKETIVCRCESITMGEIDETLTLLQPEDPNRLKAFCRVGMGRCQGRVCGTFLTEYLAARYDKPIGEIRPLRGAAPVKPLAYVKAAQLAQPGHALRRG